MDRRRRQRGVLLVAAIVLLVVVSARVAAIAFVTATSGSSATDNLRSGQALYAAESGAEFQQRNLAQNLEWYRNAVDPTVTTTVNVGQGTFAVYANLAVTELRTRMTPTSPPAAPTTWIQVYSVGRFPDAGFLLIDEDLTLGGGGEFVQYTGRDTVNNRFTGITRAVTIGTVVGADGAVTHNRASGVYPVTTLVSAMASAACATVPNPFQIAAHSKFLGAGTIDVEGEEISYTGSSTAGGVMTLTGVQRCQSSAGAAHPAGRPVTPVLIGDGSTSYQAEIVSTGNGPAGVDARVLRKIVQRP